MAPRKLTVRTEYGTFTRQSDRPYLFVVASKGRDVEYDRKQFESSRKYDLKLAAEYRATAAKGGEKKYWGDAKEPYYVVTPEQFILWAEQYEQQAKKEFDPTTHTDNVVEHGWSQSRSGAETARRRAVRYGYTNVKVFDLSGKAV